MTVIDPVKKTRARRAAPQQGAVLLQRWADWYLARFVVSEQRFQQALKRRADRLLPDDRPDPRFYRDLIDACRARGLLDDGRVAMGLVTSLSRKGVSRAGMRARLQARGLPCALIDPVLPPDTDEGWEREQLHLLCRRRGWGPFSVDRSHETANKQKQKALRAGFSWAIVQSVFAEERAF